MLNEVCGSRLRWAPCTDARSLLKLRVATLEKPFSTSSFSSGGDAAWRHPPFKIIRLAQKNACCLRACPCRVRVKTPGMRSSWQSLESCSKRQGYCLLSAAGCSLLRYPAFRVDIHCSSHTTFLATARDLLETSRMPSLINGSNLALQVWNFLYTTLYLEIATTNWQCNGTHSASELWYLLSLTSAKTSRSLGRWRWQNITPLRQADRNFCRNRPAMN